MASFDYSRARNTAQRALARYGQPAQLKRTVPGEATSGFEFDPHPAEPETELHAIVVLDLNAQIAARRDQSIAQKHQLMVAPEAPVAPEESDRVILQGTEYGIAEVRAIAPGGLLLYWEVDLAE